MKVELIAIDKADGRGIISENDKYYIVRPPYRAKDKIGIREKDVERAFFQHGFESIERAPMSIADVVFFLKNEYIDFHKQQEKDLPSPEELTRLLEYAPDDLLQKYIVRVREDYLLKNKHDIAEKLALELMGTEKVSLNPKFIHDVSQILNECREHRERKSAIIFSDVNLDQRFPRAAKRYTLQSLLEKKMDILKQGCLINVGAA